MSTPLSACYEALVAAMLREAVLIQWDEFPLTKRQHAEAVLELLEDELRTPVVLAC